MDNKLVLIKQYIEEKLEKNKNNHDSYIYSDILKQIEKIDSEVVNDKFSLSDIKKLQEVARETGIPVRTLQDRLVLKSLNMIEGEDFRHMGKGQSILLSPAGVKKIMKK